MLDLDTYFTSGEIEARAWLFKRGSKAPDCQGLIHGDFVKTFNAVQVWDFEDLMETGGKKKAKELGKVKRKGKDYVVQNGDVLEFELNRANSSKKK